MEPDEEYRDLLLFLLEDVQGDLKTEPVHYGPPLNSFEPLQVPRASAIIANGTQGAIAVKSKSTARLSQDGGKGRRKRGPTSQQQVQELEKQVAEQTAALQQLSINNVYLSERVHMLEMVIWVRDRQVERIQSIKAGLTFNPFAAMGMTPEEVQGKTPAWMAQKFIATCSIMGQRLAPVMPDLQRYPWLFGGPDPHSEWPRVQCRVGPGGETAPPFRYGGACNSLASMADGPTLQAHNYVGQLVQQQQQQQDGNKSASYGSLGRASTGSSESTITGTSGRAPSQPIPPPLEQLQPTIETLRQMVSKIDELMMGLQFKLFMFPEHSLASSLHVQAVDAGHTDWLALATSVHTSHEAAKAAGLDEGVPSVAPEAHWAQVIARTGLTDMQRMQAALLWEIFNGARSVVWAQRRALGAAMARLQQEPPSAGPSEAALGAGLGSAWDLSQGRGVGAGAGPLGGTAAGLQPGPNAAAQPVSGEGAGCMSRGGSGATSSLGPSTTAESAKSAASSGTWLASTGSGGLGSISGNGLAGVGVAGATAWKSPETLRQEASILRKLQHTVIKERCLVTLAIETMHLHVLSPVQVAVMCVNSYPFFPDEVALLHAASKEFQSDAFFPKTMQWPGRQAGSSVM